MKLIITLFIIVFSTSCSHEAKQTSEKKVIDSMTKKAEWKQKMHMFAKELSDIYPLIVSNEQFYKKSNRQKVLESTIHLKNLANELTDSIKQKMTHIPLSEPNFEIIPETLSQELNLAENAMKAGRNEFSRSILKSVSQNCVHCHTKGIKGNSYFSFDNRKDFIPLDDFSKAELYLALNNHEKALVYYKKSIHNDQFMKNDIFHWEKAVKSAISISLRFFNDKKEALKITEYLLTESNNVPLFIKTDAKSWQSDIRKWDSLAPKTGDYITKTKQLIQSAKQKNYVWGDRPSFIIYLKASIILHNSLLKEKDKNKIAEAQELLGKSYEVLDESNGYTSESYYKSCIYTLPHSDIAKRCYKLYEESIYFGYSGSRGFDAPKSVHSYLKKLKTMAF